MIYADKIIRSKRKTVAVSLDKDGAVIIKAPKFCSDREINEILLSSQGWLEKQLKKYNDRKEKYLGFGVKNNGKILLFGEIYEIKLCDIKSARAEGKVLYLPERDAESALKKYLKKIAKLYFSQRIDYLSGVTSLKPSEVKVGSAKSRWGSCNAKGIINLSFYLLLCPTDIIDYVLIHEMCHLKYMNHSNAFWDEVEKYVPDYKKKRKWLKDNSEILNILKEPQ